MESIVLEEFMHAVTCRSCSCKLEPPLMKCTSGQHFCGECNKFPGTCPSCQNPTRRDYLVERLCSTNITCPFVKTGCDFIGKPAEVAVHERSCSESSEPHSHQTTNCESTGDTDVAVPRKKCMNDDSAKSLEDTVLAELQCPVCLLRLSPPMNECQNGHLICQECLPQIVR